MPDYDELLHMLDLKTISLSTTRRWFIRLGYKYSENKRCYYTDGHKREDVVKDRNNRFLVEYFIAERRSHRWVQINETTAKNLEQNETNFPKNCFHQYLGDGGEYTMHEYHIDTHKCLFQFVPDCDKIFGASLSIRKDQNVRPLILIGQDESTYHRFIFAKKQWKGPLGQHQLLPKSEGEILMVSGMQAREFGLGVGQLLTPEIIKSVNNNREGKEYISKEDAILVNGTANKKNLTDDPLLRYFKAGVNNEGYWDCSHAKLQIEDSVDVLTILYPTMDFLFLYDQSSGHTKMRPDSLSATNTNVGVGGVHATMRNSVIQDLGPFPATLEIGEVQQMMFQENDIGPF